MDRSGELATVRNADAEARDDETPDTFSLVVVEGPDAGASCVVDASSPARVLVGKSPMCTFRLTDEQVSRRHASLRPQGRGLVLEDLSSTNGTTINGVAVREAILRGGEALRVGRTVLAVTRGAPSFVAQSRETSFGRVLGASRAMRRLYPVLAELAASDRPALLEGETGTGKELCAEELHARSRRAARPFAVLACNALPGAEIAERLFGDQGLLAAAAGGTVLIDEVAALPLPVQGRLVNELDPRRAASTSTTRLLFATRRDIDRDVTEGRFHEDLLAALAPTRVELPPLRERAGDVALLAQTFWSALHVEEPERSAAELPADFVPRFVHYDWPGNVRELSRAVSSRFFLGELAPWRSAADAPLAGDVVCAVLDRELPLSEARRLVVDDFERRYVSFMVARYGSTRDAARASGVALRYFQVLRARLER